MLEMKNDMQAIKDCHFYNTATVFVEEGIPATKDESRLLIFEASYFNSKVDNCFFECKGTSFIYLIELWSGPINTKLTVKKFKEKIGEITGKNPQLMRLREKSNEKLFKVCHDNKQMDDYNVADGKELAIQMLEAQENPKEDEQLIMVKVWDPNEWTLTPVKELYVERTCDLKEFAAILSSVSGIPVILEVIL